MKNTGHLRWIWNIWRERKGLILLLFFLTLLSSLVAVSYPYLTKILIDMLQKLIESHPSMAQVKKETLRLAGLFIAVGMTGLVASLFPGIRGAVNVVFEHLIRMKYFSTVLVKDYRFFATFRSGDIVTRLTDDIYEFPKLGWFLCSGIFRAVESISKVLFCLAAMFFLNGKLTLLSLIPLPLTILVFYIVQDRIYDTFRRNQEAISDINSQLELSFSGVRIIKAYACEHKYRRFFSDALARRFKTEMAVVKLGTVLDMIYMYIDYIAQLVVVFAGGYMAVRGQISIGTFYAFYNYLGMLIYPILDIPQLFVSGKRAFVNIDRLEELARFPAAAATAQLAATTPPATITADDTGTASKTAATYPNQAQVPQFEGLSLKHVSFRYSDRDSLALQGVNLSVRRGERVAILGAVGSGKSTLLKVIAGLLPPHEGQILLNNKPISEYPQALVSRMMAYVPQEALLFSGTIRENLAFGSPGPGSDISQEAYEEAVTIAQMKKEIEAFPLQDKTMLGQRGLSLSGGQKQRLAIARALARKPQVLLLDDMTASLDAANEELLWRALTEQYQNMTSLVVTHRLSTLQYVDRILFFEDGIVQAFGRHEELQETCPAYRAFIQEHMQGKM
ncbi:ABC transporter ATP-binding protein [Gracilinema caldarium]|uniref:ABC transporter ATP-binding protein n=1 Tax=Gracilinema caldarium TaxID=215591 RepID=UPI0026EC40B2|nr:ABC transporter ATP-binding protein [Gracilinema caldarium]